MPDEHDSQSTRRLDVARGVVGCFITLGATTLGAVAGGVWAWRHRTPTPHDGLGSEWHGLSVFVDQLVEAGTGILVGGVVGLISGVAISIMILRRRRT